MGEDVMTCDSQSGGSLTFGLGCCCRGHGHRVLIYRDEGEEMHGKCVPRHGPIAFVADCSCS